jgi:hypothetical protein
MENCCIRTSGLSRHKNYSTANIKVAHRSLAIKKILIQEANFDMQDDEISIDRQGDVIERFKEAFDDLTLWGGLN